MYLCQTRAPFSGVSNGRPTALTSRDSWICKSLKSAQYEKGHSTATLHCYRSLEDKALSLPKKFSHEDKETGKQCTECPREYICTPVYL